MRQPNGLGNTATWLLLVALAVAALCFLPAHAVNLTSPNSPWTAQGCFKLGSVNPATRFDKRISLGERKDLTLWGSWGDGSADTGELLSPAFKAPRILELVISGYAGTPGLEIFLERQDNGARFPLPVGVQPTEYWRKYHCWIPAEIRGRSVRLVAVDKAPGATGWLGVSNPLEISLLGLFQQQLRSSLLPMLIFLAQLALFLVPGFVLAGLLAARRPLGPIYLVVIVIATGATLGYLAFWAYFFSKVFGIIFSYGVYALSASVLLPRVRSKAAFKITAQQIAEPLLYSTLAGLCYACFYFLFASPYAPGSFAAGNRFFTLERPGDNIIPYIFDERIYDRKPVRPFCCDDWLSSDRPPLQAGIVLLERPFPLMKDMDLRYELLASALQCFWICGVWCLLKSLNTPRRRIRQVLGFLIFSGFLFYNSVYTWPKLLAAACLLFVLAIVFEALRTKRPTSYFEAAMGAVCLGLALMAHPGSAFSLLGVAILVLWQRRLFAWRQIALAAAIAAVFYLPWSAYQKFVDPPGNRLLKMHLAGAIPIDARTTWEAIRDAYESHSAGEIIRYKWSNVVFLAGRKFFDAYGLGDVRWQGGPHIDTAATESSRIAQREWIWNAVGIANAGWLAAPIVLLTKRRKSLAVPFSGWLIALAIFNLLCWSVVTFGPNETVTTHSSYADILLVMVGLSGFLLTLPRFVYLLLLSLQVFNFFVVWVWSLPARIIPPVLIQLPLLGLGIVAMGAVLWVSFWPGDLGDGSDG